MADSGGKHAQPLKILVRGVGDVASAVAHRLHLDGHYVALHQGGTPPLVHRRAMAFADAWFDGSTILAGIRAERRDTPGNDWRAPGIIVFACDFEALLPDLHCQVLIDARMRKRAVPEDQRGLAPLVIGLGPGFVAGENVDWAIETSWGAQLGGLLLEGATLPLTGEPRLIGAVGRERIVYAPCSGMLHTYAEIGAEVIQGAVVAEIGGLPIATPIAGTVRGLVHGDIVVPEGTKLLEIDPRPRDKANFSGLGERPGRIAEGIAAALLAWTTKHPVNVPQRENVSP